MGRLFTHAAKRLLLVMVGAGLALVAAEMAIRLTDLEPPRMWKFNHTVGWTYEPGLRSWYTTSEFRTWVEINSKGLHDLERPYAKAPGVFRVVTLGDSFTAAVEVPFHASFPRLLEGLLQAHAGPTKIEVINLGVGGFSTINELVMYKHEGAQYRPDLVILNFFMPDIRDHNPRVADNYVPGAPYVHLSNGKLEVRHFPVDSLTRVKRLIGRFRVARLSYKIARSLNTRGTNTPPDSRIGSPAPPAESSMDSLFVDPPSPAWEQAWQTTFALIRELKQTVEESGGTLAVMWSPAARPSHLSDEEFERPHRRLVNFLTQEKIPHVTFFEAFKNHSKVSDVKLNFPRDKHLTEAGHRIVAGVLADFLRSSGLVPGAGYQAKFKRPSPD